MAPSVLVLVRYVFRMIGWRVEVSFVQRFFLPLGFFQPMFLPTPPPPSSVSLLFLLY